MARPLSRYGPVALSETDLRLLVDVRGAQVLEIGCGIGHSFLYLAQQGTAQVWGLDFFPAQIEFASALRNDNGLLVCS
jgi:cyclopropane fatty-acyl-phospholipid synthase-like methyltransferase